MFEQRLEGDEGGNSCIYLGESILGRRNSKCKDPEVELGLVCEGAVGGQFTCSRVDRARQCWRASHPQDLVLEDIPF